MTDKLHGKNLRIWIFALLGGIVFAAFDRCGYMIQHYGTLWAISENPLHKTIFHRILIRVPLFTAGVLISFLLLNWLRGRSTDSGAGLPKRESQGSTAPQTAMAKSLALCSATQNIPAFIKYWLLYFISFLPAFLGGYPGLFAADAPNQIGWTFSGWLTAHHPLLHTGILCGIFSMTRALGWSDNTAAALCNVLQMIILAGIFAWISCFLKRKQAPQWLRIGTVLFFCLFPFHGMMAVYTTKDTVFSGVLVLCLLQVICMCSTPEEYFKGWRHTIFAGITFSLLLLLRNNGFHTMLACVPFLLIYLWKYRKKLLVLALGLVLVYGVYNGPFLNVIGAEPGNAREMYNIVIQTLSRTYVAGGDIRPEEMDVIRPVMDEETMALYTPNLSDPVKNQFHTDAFEEEKAEFLKTWFQVGCRNKKIYIDAFLNTTLGFWYPDVENEYLEFVCFDIQKDDPHYPHVQMEPKSEWLNRYYTAIGTDASFRQIQIVRELLSMGLYFWLLVLTSLYLIYQKEYGKLLWILPLWMYLGTSLLGPAALLRYGYPLMAACPILLFTMWKKEA